MKPRLVSGAQYRDLLPNAPEASAAWSTFSVYVHESAPRGAAIFSDHLVGLRLSGTSRLRQQVGSKFAEGWASQGCVAIVPAGLSNTWESDAHSGTPRGIAVFVPQAYLARVLVQDWQADPKQTEIYYRFMTRDPVIDGVLTRLAFEAKNGSPSGSIYAESACEFLAHHIINAHSSVGAQPPRWSGGLPARKLKLILDYIEENLAELITLRRLAELSEVSPRHFERAFRQAVGVPPYRYVLRRRVDVARNLLLSHPKLPIQEIAALSGFSSPSHLASAFRRETGYTPTEFRRHQAH